MYFYTFYDSIVAGIGLAIDSATTVISSMLLSPIMGPVLGMAVSFTCVYFFSDYWKIII